MGTVFSRLEVHGWRQFESVDLDFTPRLTVITGANGTGKTTLLSLLTKHFGWQAQFVAVPRRDRSGLLSYLTGWRPWRRSGVTEEARVGGQLFIGSLSYAPSRGARESIRSELWVAEGGAAQVFDVNMTATQPVHGVYLPSHRPAPTYGPVYEIPTRVGDPAQLIEEYEQEYRARFFGVHSAMTSLQRLKRSLIAVGAFGFGNEIVRRDEGAVDVFLGFQEVLQKLLPPSLRFERIAIESPEVVLETGTGRFSLDAVSGGVASLIDTAWRVYMRSLQDPELSVIFDEPENHLHPELQRALLPGLLSAFPKAQFIAATHNPFIVGSVQEANVYVLDYDGEGRVESKLLDTVNRAGTSNEILRDVLGLQFTLPIWVEDQVQASIARFRTEPLTETSLDELRQAMAAVGIEHLFPQVLADALGEGPPP